MTESRLRFQFGMRTLLIAFVWVGLCLHAIVHWSTYGPLMLLILLTAAAATRFTWRGGLCLSFWVMCYIVDCFEWESKGTTYFSPDTLRTRRVLEVVPAFLGGYHLYRAQPIESKHALAEHLIKLSYWERRTTEEETWIFSARYSFLRLEDRSYWQKSEVRSYWHKYVTRESDEWIKWTEDNPKLAAEVWPRILKVLRQESPFDQSTEIAAGILVAVRGINDVRELDAWEQSGE